MRWPQVLRDQYKTFITWYGHRYLQKYVLEFLFGGPKVRSILWPHHHRLWEKIQMPSIKKKKHGWELASYRKILCHSWWSVWSIKSMNSPPDLSSSYEVKGVCCLKFRQKRDRSLDTVPMCFSRRDASADMQHHLLDSPGGVIWHTGGHILTFTYQY